jgi:hypothetical protein
LSVGRWVLDVCSRRLNCVIGREIERCLDFARHDNSRKAVWVEPLRRQTI